MQSKKKNTSFAGLSIVIASVAMVLFAYLKKRMIGAIAGQSLGGKAALGALSHGLYLLYGIVVAVLLVRLFRKERAHKMRLLAGSITVIIALFLCLVFPYTMAYAKVYCGLFRDNMEQAIRMFETQELERYRIGENEYAVPDRFASMTGTMYVEREKDNVSAFFYSFRGLYADSVIAYITNGDFLAAEISSDGQPQSIPPDKSARLQQIDQDFYFLVVR